MTLETINSTNIEGLPINIDQDEVQKKQKFFTYIDQLVVFTYTPIQFTKNLFK